MRRNVSLKALDYGKVEEASGGSARQVAKIVAGISSEKAREVNKKIKEVAAEGHPVADAGRAGTRDRQEARRPPDRDRGAEGARLRHPAAVPETSGTDSEARSTRARTGSNYSTTSTKTARVVAE